MKWPTRNNDVQKLKKSLQTHSATIKALPGVDDPDALETLAMQFVASLRREEYYAVVQARNPGAERANPNDLRFDAERAVAFHLRTGNIDEASWLVFLMTHFARPADTGWLRLKQVYGKLGLGIWDWKTVSADPGAFSDWVYANSGKIEGKFGNHRKYESLEKGTKREFSKVLQSYVDLVGGDHEKFFAAVVRAAGNDPHVIFDHFYRRIKAVHSFGRLAKFDFLMLLSRYKIVPIEPGSAYLSGATGPATGVRLLFLGNPEGAASVRQLQSWLDELDKSLSVGMAVMEDALCNWQKSPQAFVHFKG